MRRHENIGYGSFNSYRSGDENSRQYDYGNPEGHSRGGRSVYGQMSRDNDASNRPYSTSSGYGSAYNSENDYGNSNSYSGNSQNRSQNPQNQGWSNQNQRQNYGSSNYGSSNYGSSNYGSSNYGNSGGYGNRNDRDSNWMDRAGNRMENWADRAGNQMDRWGNRISNAWDRITDSDEHGHNYRSSNRNHWSDQQRSMGGQHNYSHGNANEGRYSDNYDGNSGSYGSGSYGGRYESRYGNSNRYDDIRRSHQDDGGFFDNLGNRISNAWDRWVGNDEEEQRRYENRSRYGSSGHHSGREQNW